jgi:predicted nucleic acid-binding protein
MRILVDVNVFIDVQRQRRNWDTSYLILKTVIDGKNEGFISALTPAIIYFLRREITSEAQARQDTLDVIEGFKMVDLTDSLIQASFVEKRIEDVEDAIQFHSATRSNSILITRNKKDFQKEVTKDVEVLTPEEFLKTY